MNFLKNFCFKNKTVLIRVDFNVPLNERLEITDDSRILAALPTIQNVLASGAKIVLISHLGRPKGVNKKLSLFPVSKKLENLLKKPVLFLNDCVGEEIENNIKNSDYSSVILLENLRFYDEETSGDPVFSKKLSRLADVYINDAFGTSHRAHASTHGVVEYFNKEKYCGLLLEKEVLSLSKVFHKNRSPSLAVIGGAKISSKIDAIFSLINCVDKIIIGGGMAFTFIRALGGAIGTSLFEEDKINSAKEILTFAKQKDVSVLLPIDSVNSNCFSNEISSTTNIFKIPKGSMGLDIGPKSITLFEKEILLAKNIIWNGPMGVFEFSNFSKGTKLIGEAIAKSTDSGAYSLVGGGDSITAIKKYNLENRVSYVSTGGGAMLEFLEGKELPALKALL
tara:strand:- start:1203 stop:2384 length:1182 start_codon:yes stop_codon:yes gene_type:complete